MYDQRAYLSNVMLIIFVLELAITTDDHSRVRLKDIPNVPGSDYINANYIDVSSTFEHFPQAPHLFFLTFCELNVCMFGMILCLPSF